MTARVRGVFLAAALLAAQWSGAVAAAPALLTPPGVGDPAPEAAGIVVNGPEGSRVTALAGRVRVVEFWASWCGPCIESIPRLEALRHEVHKAGFADQFEVLGVGLDQRLEDARRFLHVRPVSYPVVVDTIGIASRSYGVWRLPATFLVDQSGHIRQIYSGYGPGFGADLRARVFELLAQPQPEALSRAAQSAGNP